MRGRGERRSPMKCRTRGASHEGWLFFGRARLARARLSVRAEIDTLQLASLRCFVAYSRTLLRT